MKKLFMCLLCFFSFTFMCEASECDTLILGEASKVKVEAQEAKEIDEIAGETIYWNIIVSNLTPNLYVEVYEDKFGTTTTYTYEETENGVLTIRNNYIFAKVNYTVNVYANSENCTEVLNELRTSTKKFNVRYKYKVCEDNKDYEKCDPFYEYENEEEEQQTDEEFYEEMQEYYERKNETTFEKVMRYIKEYYLFVLIPVILIGGTYIVLIILHKKRMKEGAK